LHPTLGEIVALLRSAKPSVRLSMTTNGLALTSRVREMMVRAGFDHVLISIHAASPATYRRLTGGDYDRLLANVQSLVTARADANSRTPEIGLALALNTVNAGDALEYPSLGR